MPGPGATLPRVRIPIWIQLALLAAPLAVLPAVGIGWFALDVKSEALVESLRDLQRASTDEVAGVLEASFSEAQNGLDAVGRTLTDTALTPDARIALARHLVAASAALDHAGVYSVDGASIDTLAEAGAPALPATLPAALLASAGERNLAIGETSADRAVRLLVVVPIRAAGRVTGYVASRVALDDVQARVEAIAAARFAGETDAVYVVDDQLRVIAHPDRERALALTPAGGEGILSGLAAGAARNRVGKTGEYRGADGRAMFGSLRPLTGRPLAVVAQVPRARVYAPLAEMRRVVILAVAAAALLAVLAALLFARRVTAPVRPLVAFAGELAARKFGKRLDLRRQDEWGQLATALSNASVDLEASEAQALKDAAIRADLGRYLDRELVDQIVRREAVMKLGGVRTPVTILFADVVAFTPMAEKLPAEDVVAMLNQLFTILTEITFRHGGTVDKFIGDCLMAMWGAPREQPDHAARALAAAQDMLRWLEAGQAEWADKYKVDVRLAIGINTGEAIIGNIGSETRMEYTAIGDTVNVAARVEAIARPNQILCTLATRTAAGDDFEYTDAGTRELTGRSGAVALFEVTP